MELESRLDFVIVLLAIDHHLCQCHLPVGEEFPDALGRADEFILRNVADCHLVYSLRYLVEKRVALITSKIESWDTLGLLEYIPGWCGAIENAYDAIFRNIRDKLRELYPETTADAPAWQLLSSDNFTEYYDFVMHLIE